MYLVLFLNIVFYFTDLPGGEGNLKWLLVGYRASLRENENILELDSGDQCSTL